MTLAMGERRAAVLQMFSLEVRSVWDALKDAAVRTHVICRTNVADGSILNDVQACLLELRALEFVLLQRLDDLPERVSLLMMVLRQMIVLEVLLRFLR